MQTSAVVDAAPRRMETPADPRKNSHLWLTSSFACYTCFVPHVLRTAYACLERPEAERPVDVCSPHGAQPHVTLNFEIFGLNSIMNVTTYLLPYISIS